MALEPATLNTLREVLKTCSAEITGVTGSRGTGFFVDADLLLTCAHVVTGNIGECVEVRPFGRTARKGWIRDVRPAKDLDLALVEVAAVDEEDAQPAVALDYRLHDDINYYAVGYPKEEIVGGSALEAIKYPGHRRSCADGEVLLVLEAGGPLITSGLSGGALLSTETGAVVAIAQYAQDTDKDSGGAAIPIERAGREFDEVRRLVGDPPTATRRWRDTLGQPAWEALGKKWGWRRSHDVVLEGGRSAWQVWIDPDDADRQELTVRNLPDEVSEALFQWAQRRRPRREGEVKLLARLLAAAVFPDPVAARIWRDRQADELRVRLRIPGESELFDVPWEFVTVQSKPGEQYGTAEKGLALVRTAPHVTPAEVSTGPATGEAGVLAAVVQPAEWQARMPSFVYSGKTVSWPTEGGLIGSLHETVENVPGFRFLLKDDEPLADPTRWDFETALEQPTPDGVSLEIVHYIGFGHVENGEAQLAFSDSYGDVEWAPVSDFLRRVAASGARMLVVECALPRFDMELEPISPRAFLPALSNRLNAVVVTRFPVHPRQFQVFNTALYRELGHGRSVEAAVHMARWQLYRSPSLDDAAGFGWFTLITGPQADMRLLPAKRPHADWRTSPLRERAAQREAELTGHQSREPGGPGQQLETYTPGS